GLVARLPDVPLLVAMSARPGDAAADPHLVREIVESRWCRRLRLAELDPASVRTMLEPVLDTARGAVVAAAVEGALGTPRLRALLARAIDDRDAPPGGVRDLARRVSTDWLVGELARQPAAIRDVCHGYALLDGLAPGALGELTGHGRGA